jgi:glycosyltransferase involved in cell wall biosynthesis
MIGKSINKTIESQHVVMLVNNTCVNDSRVIKSAEVIAQTGRRVTVVCRSGGGLPMDEVRNCVHYLRIDPIPKSWKLLLHILFKNPSTSTNQLKKYELLSSAKILLFLPIIITSIFFLKIFEIFKKNIDPSSNYLGKLSRHGNSYLNKLLRITFSLVKLGEFDIAVAKYVINLAPDLIHAHDLSTLPIGAKVAKKIGAKLIYDSHELEMHRNAKYSRMEEKKRRQLEQRYIRQANCVITVSDSIADHLRDDYKINRPLVIMNTPLFDAGKTVMRDVRSDLNLDLAAKLAVYVGSVTVNRGIEQVVQALVHAPDLHFATIGPRRPETESEAVAIAIRLGVRDRLHFINPVPPEDVVSYIRSAGVSVLPIQNVCLSYYYCMPNKLMESVFASVPVAVANLLEMRRFVETYQCGVVIDETCPKKIAESLMHVLEQRDQYILPPEIRKSIAQNYGWSSQADKIRSTYEFLLPSAICL